MGYCIRKYYYCVVKNDTILEFIALCDNNNIEIFSITHNSVMILVFPHKIRRLTQLCVHINRVRDPFKWGLDLNISDDQYIDKLLLN